MKFLISSIALSALFLAGCNTATETNKENLNTNQTKSEPNSGKFTTDFISNPAEAKAGEQTELSFTVRNDKGVIVKDLPDVHEKPMHLMVFSEDLAEYFHIHPEPQADGTYKVQHIFPNGGNFKLYADFTPMDSPQVVETFNLKVSGNERPKVELKADGKLEKTIDGMKFVMKPDGDLVAGKELMLNISVFDEKTNQPVTDLEKYLGEYAHFAIVSQDLSKFVHAHPMSEEEHSKGKDDLDKIGDKKENVDESKPHSHKEKSELEHSKSPSEVTAHTSFPKSGLFKVFAQFKRGGKVITVPFVVNIKQAGSKAKNDAAIPNDAIKITVSGSGFEPKSVPAKIGQSVKLAFFRKDAENCGGEIVFPTQNIKKTLPVGETVIVEITPKSAGDIKFSCGMDMMKGKIVVSE